LSIPHRQAALTPCAELSNEQRQAIFAAPDFTSFIEESTKIVQRALSDGYDYIRDYTVGLEGAL
jgi:dynein intermediate chain